MSKKYIALVALSILFFTIIYFLFFYQKRTDKTFLKRQSQVSHIVFVDKTKPSGWYRDKPRDAYEIMLSTSGMIFYAYVYDRTKGNKTTYDTVIISSDKKEVLATLKRGIWSNWHPVEFKTTRGKRAFSSNVKIKVFELSDDGAFRIRLLAVPSNIPTRLTEGIEIIVDFVNSSPSTNLQKSTEMLN